MKVFIAILFSLIASVGFNYSAYVMKREVDKLPKVKFEFSWPVLKAFITCWPWIAGVLISIAGGAFYAVALLFAPVSIVQPLAGTGIVLLAYLAIKNLGEKPKRMDLAAAGMIVLGVALIGVSMAEGVPENVKHDPVELWIFTGVAVLLSLIIPLAMRRDPKREGAALGVCVGILYGLTAIFGKLLLVDWANRWPKEHLMGLFSSVFLIAWVVTLIAGFITYQAALQRGMAVVVAPVVAGLSQLIPILGGTIALNEPFPKNPGLIAARIIAFALIMAATVILSSRAEEILPTEVEEDQAQRGSSLNPLPRQQEE
ncbi:MAG: hypothetical protein PHO53_02905 [Actinomycetota bacterium]|nr:hypothetical protein [Actinomycetota bacterium]